MQEEWVPNIRSPYCTTIVEEKLVLPASSFTFKPCPLHPPLVLLLIYNRNNNPLTNLVGPECNLQVLYCTVRPGQPKLVCFTVPSCVGDR